MDVSDTPFKIRKEYKNYVHRGKFYSSTYFKGILRGQGNTFLTSGQKNMFTWRKTCLIKPRVYIRWVFLKENKYFPWNPFHCSPLPKKSTLKLHKCYSLTWKLANKISLERKINFSVNLICRKFILFFWTLPIWNPLKVSKALSFIKMRSFFHNRFSKNIYVAKYPL